MDKRILIIEDDLILALSLEMMLKRIGCSEIQKVETGEEAIEAAESFKPDLLLVDVQLGSGITGIEAVEVIQSKSDVPALYVTGNSDQFFREKAEKTNFLDYLIKPITYRELSEVLCTHA
jgi:two-component SAPR family response regulator